MSSSESVASSLVHAYLNGRTMSRALHDAIIDLVRRRLVDGKMPALHDTLRCAIDDQAEVPEGDFAARANLLEHRIMCFVPRGGPRGPPQRVPQLNARQSSLRQER